jgi:hypothetical protein
MHGKIAAHDLFVTPNCQFHLKDEAANKIVCSRRLTLSINIDLQSRPVYSTSYRPMDVKPASRTVRNAKAG